MPPRAASSSTHGPAAFTTRRARSSRVPPPRPSRSARRRRRGRAGRVEARAPRRGWRRRRLRPPRRAAKPTSSRSLLAACASCQSAAPLRPLAGRPGTRRSASAAERVRPSGMLSLGGQVPVAVARQQVVQRSGRARAPRDRAAVAVEGTTKRSGSHQLRRDRAAASRRSRADSRSAATSSALQVAHAAVDRLQAVPGNAGAEVLALDERHREPALRGVPGHGGAVDPAADHDHVPLARRERREIAFHARAAVPPFE